MLNKLTVVISALNEQSNIASLLSDLLCQDLSKVKLHKIYVISDGSTDNTVINAKSVNSDLIKVKSYRRRKGKSARINEIFKLISGPVVVLDADIKIIDDKFLYKISKPIIDGFDLTSCEIGSVETRTFFESILRCNLETTNAIFSRYNNGYNVYTCRGVARAFSYKLVKNIHFPPVVGEDAYSFFYCITNGYKYKFVVGTKVLIRLPDNINDYLKQSLRFSKSRKVMSEIFNYVNIGLLYRLPSSDFVKTISKSFLSHPLLNISYIFIYIISFVFSPFYQNKSDLWNIAYSSKKLN